ncbi:TOMM system kinase/cyclase fusion protein [Gammaproteobacteria bacterium 45_16_T64]|nr:TOMM system kinase/cyclase fusion protein [Gammaproteobacteria bacterium 45_16_T64]
MLTPPLGDGEYSDSHSIKYNLSGYEFIGVLGKGGFGQVFLATQLSTSRSVAIKILKLPEDMPADSKQHLLNRFQREALLCAQLNHPHVVQLLDRGQTDDGVVYVVFEYVEGVTLKDLLDQEGVFAADEAHSVMGQVLDAICYAHSAGVIHRDLKPQNIMVTWHGMKPHAKILDFGIGAFSPDFQHEDYKNLTMTHEMLGTPSYAAPEQLRGELPTIQSDIYAWGLVLLECLTGQPAIQGLSVAEVFHQQLSPADVPLPPSIAGHELGGLLRRVLKKKTQDRYSDPEQLRIDFMRLAIADLVGDITFQRESSVTSDQYTVATTSSFTEKRQLTVLCCSVGLFPRGDTSHDVEVMESLQRDQISLYSDVISSFGGYVAGVFADRIMVYWGYPYAGDTDIRLAARTALELVRRMRRQQEYLLQEHDALLDFRIGMHTGTVVADQAGLPTGLTPNIALKLENITKPGTILVSEACRQCLDGYAEFEREEQLNAGDYWSQYPVYQLLGELQSEAMTSLGVSERRNLIGRDSEIEQLQSLWHSTRIGVGRAALIKGEAGIGKSHLLRSLRCDVGREGYESAELRCLPEHKNRALYPILSFLRQRLSLSECNDDQVIERLEKAMSGVDIEKKIILPILLSWLSLPFTHCYVASQLTPSHQKAIIIQALTRWLLTLAEERPFLLLLEDVHWVDPTTVELLEHLLPSLASTPLAFYMTSRPKGPEFAYDGVLHVELTGLDSASAVEVIEEVLGEQHLPLSVISNITERTDGVPLFLEELTRMIVETGGGNSSSSGQSLEIPFVPHTLKDSLMGRLDNVGKAKRTVQLASAIGREFNYVLLTAASNESDLDIQSDLDDLIEAKMIYRQRRVDQDCYIFRHALIRDAAYDSMTRTTREEMHYQLAEAIEDKMLALDVLPGSEDSTSLVLGLARHLEGAGNIRRALDWWGEAGELSAKVSAHAEACNHYNRAVELIEQLKISGVIYNDLADVELSIRGALGGSLTAAFGWSSIEVEKNMEKISGVNQQQNIEFSLVEIWVQFSSALTLHEDDKVSTLLGKLSAVNRKPAQEFLFYLMRGMSSFYQGNFIESKVELEAANRYIETLSDTELAQLPVDTPALPYVHLAWGSFVSDEEVEALSLMERGLSLSEGDIFSEALSLTFSSAMRLFTRDSDGLVEHAQRCMTLSREGEFLVLEEVGRVCLGYAAVLQGDVSHGIAEMQLGMSRQVEARHRLFVCVYYSKLAEAQLFYQKDIQGCLHTIAKAKPYADELFGCFFRPELFRLEALCYQKMRHPEKANKSIQASKEALHTMSLTHADSSFFARRILSVASEDDVTLI